MPQPHRWTPEQARANASKGGLAFAQKCLLKASGVVEAKPDTFSASRLTRIRKQLVLIDDWIEAELAKSEGPDAQRIDRLAAASMRLSDQEFALANRPKPGQYRPAPPKRQSSQSGGLIE